MIVWPIQGQDPKKHWPVRRSREFAALRGGGTRHHAGVDLTAKYGDVVVATEDGRLVAKQSFNGPKAVALLLETDSGRVILYGEIAPNSWRSFGLSIGSRVVAGQPVGWVGINPGGSQMLHFELYRKGTRSNKRWMVGDAPPSALIDPTQYLDAAAGSTAVVPSPTSPVPRPVPQPPVTPPPQLPTPPAIFPVPHDRYPESENVSGLVLGIALVIAAVFISEGPK